VGRTRRGPRGPQQGQGPGGFAGALIALPPSHLPVGSLETGTGACTARLIAAVRPQEPSKLRDAEGDVVGRSGLSKRAYVEKRANAVRDTLRDGGRAAKVQVRPLILRVRRSRGGRDRVVDVSFDGVLRVVAPEAVAAVGGGIGDGQIPVDRDAPV